MVFNFLILYVLPFLAFPTLTTSFLHCNNGINANAELVELEPTMADLFNASTGGYLKIPEFNVSNGDSLGKIHYNVINATVRIATNFGKVRAPLRSLISDGVFTLKDDQDFSSVYLAQRNYWSFGLICYFMQIQNEWLCGNSDLKKQFMKATGNMPFITSNDWKISKPDKCTSQDCTVRVDPLRSACIWINDTSQTTDVKYVIETSFFTFSESSFVKKRIESTIENAAIKSVINALFSLVQHAVEMVPTYLGFGILGAAIIYSAESLSADPLFQYSVVALIGAVLFVAWAAYKLYKLAEDAARKEMPYLVPLVTVVSAAFATTAGSYHFSARYFGETILSVWDEGIFGFHWLGKVGILGAMLVSMIIARVLNLFKREPEDTRTTAENVLYYFVRGAGMYFLGCSCPNLELGMVAVGLGFNYETIEYYSWLLYLRANAVPANRVPKKQVQQIVDATTERELRKLREYINRNAAEVDGQLQRSENYDQIKGTIGRFRNGHHNGRAFADEEVEEGQTGGGKLRHILVSVILMVVVGAVAVFVADK